LREGAICQGREPFVDKGGKTPFVERGRIPFITREGAI